MSERRVIVYATCDDRRAPVLSIIERPNGDVVFSWPCYGGLGFDLHATLHRWEAESSGSPFLLTIYHSGKSPTWRDEEEVKIARGLNLKNPERHGKYLRHAPLCRGTNEEGYEVIGTRVDLWSAPDRPRYARRERVELVAPLWQFWLYIDLATEEFPIERDGPRVHAGVGDFLFRCEPPRGR